MSTRVSALAALGLEPGADSAAIERAYKRLIKQYHPDRAGGDSRRAAEINRAYRELRSERSKEALILDDADAFGVRQYRWMGAWVLGAGAVLALALMIGSLGRFTDSLAATSAPPNPLQELRAAAPAEDRMEQPIAVAAVDAAIRDAVGIAMSEDEVALAEASRKCHQKLRRNPGLAQLDRCTAFDSAVIQLQNRDPLRDRGPFSELAVTGRLMSAATMLSNDYLAIDSRLRRIRLRVELALAPQLPPPTVETPEID